jgi:hypothetical protein
VEWRGYADSMCCFERGEVIGFGLGSTENCIRWEINDL